MLVSSLGTVASSFRRTSANARADEILMCSTAIVRDVIEPCVAAWVMASSYSRSLAQQLIERNRQLCHLGRWWSQPRNQPGSAAVPARRISADRLQNQIRGLLRACEHGDMACRHLNRLGFDCLGHRSFETRLDGA